MTRVRRWALGDPSPQSISRAEFGTPIERINGRLQGTPAAFGSTGISVRILMVPLPFARGSVGSAHVGGGHQSRGSALSAGARGSSSTVVVRMTPQNLARELTRRKPATTWSGLTRHRAEIFRRSNWDGLKSHTYARRRFGHGLLNAHRHKWLERTSSNPTGAKRTQLRSATTSDIPQPFVSRSVEAGAMRLVRRRSSL